ncbi:exopolyphosphatase / guanosine-5'-triphosphate,3'-diphosphate pyrophosphatase [Noviherbaspirillum humi]|uniref:Exopolyphosphatase / guanosine-5'-triphosphate,3'-diphosphate pyrophosphatase n=1 Tax=Noviherbaspirillum humi TaxID=1688639 RepID=A0A239LCP0_9BURK|nr:Ppx/GppA phosphatase family protein [Noviherbaspirillum humi]SNT27722.1 exopolyphosphatase / guanosine-5'-triphosphate,3'-diphosphate pyrophosphatase [Noviherbaspirillum humi]
MFAAVDLGSNSFRLHIGERDGDAIRIVKTARDPIRLAAGLDDKGYLTDSAMQTALQSLRDFRKLLDGYPLDAVRVVATNTLRVAANAREFLPKAEQAIGYPIEVISGEEEGRLIYMGVAGALAQADEKRLVIDIGGGSTELILGEGSDIRHVESFSIGTFRQGAMFFPRGAIDARSFDAAVLSARSTFEDAAPMYHPQLWRNAYGSSGTIRAISDVIQKNGLGDGTMSLPSLLALRDKLIEAGHVDAFTLPGIKPERVIVMVGGLSVLIGIMQQIGVTGMKAVNAGLRMGVLWDLQLRGTKRDRRERSVREFMHCFHVDEGRAARVAGIAAMLYNQLKPDSGTYVRYLYWGGLLHEAGMVISHTGFHKHSAYIVEHADLPGFTNREQETMAQLILGQKGNLRKVRGLLAEPDLAKALLALRLATMFLHSNIESDAGDMKVRMKSRIEIDIERQWLDRHPTLSFWLQKERDAWDEVGVSLTVRLT